MASSLAPVRGPTTTWAEAIQQKVYQVQEKILDLCGTDDKVYTLFVIGRVLQAAALATLVASIGFAFFATPFTLLGLLPAILIGAVGTYIADDAQGLYDKFQYARPFVPGQPCGIMNPIAANCWLSASLQLLQNSPNFHRRLRQIPQMAAFLDQYNQAAVNHLKYLPHFDTQVLRQTLSQSTQGLIRSSTSQEDAAVLFEYLFQGGNSLYQFDQRINGRLSDTTRPEPMISIILGQNPGAGFEQLFSQFFNSADDRGMQTQLTFQHEPDDLVVQLRRFVQFVDPQTGVYDHHKINDKIAVPMQMAIPRHLVRDGNHGANYVCDGFLVHMGSLNGGHYASYVKKILPGGRESWWCCSDSRVYEVSLPTVEREIQNAYIVHYSRAALRLPV